MVFVSPPVVDSLASFREYHTCAGSIHSMRAVPLVFGGLLMVVLGCNKQSAEPIARFSEPPRPIATSGSSNAFREYCRIGIAASKMDPSMLYRGIYTPQMKKQILKDLANELVELRACQKSPCTFEFTALGPFSSRPEHAGWQMLGKCLQWQIEFALKADDTTKATAALLTGTRLGWDLTAGGASDASVGYAIVNQCRKAFAPSLNKLSAVSLQSLSQNLQGILSRAPKISDCLENERLNMMLAVDTVIDMRAEALDNEKKWEAFPKQLGPIGNDVTKALKLVKPEAAAAWFRDWAKEANEETELVESSAAKPASERGEWPKPTMAGRPWGMLSRVFFRSSRSVLAMHDEALARTRLMVVLAHCLSAVKSKQAAPIGIQGLAEPHRIDPYSGKPFVYQAAGTDFKLYSVGANLRDDGGQTDESFSAPDMLVEFEN